MQATRQLNVEIPTELMEELRAYSESVRVRLRFVVEDLIREALSTRGPTTKKSSKRTIPGKKSKPSRGRRNVLPSPSTTELIV